MGVSIHTHTHTHTHTGFLIQLVPAVALVFSDDRALDVLAMANGEDDADKAIQDHETHVRSMQDTHFARYLTHCTGDTDLANCKARAVAYLAKIKQFCTFSFILSVASNLRCGACRSVELIDPELARAFNRDVVAMQTCSRCMLQNYCSGACQKQAWAGHKKMCVPFQGQKQIETKKK
jgi:hypothetical protein